jgi:hypothetical protein
MRNKSNRHAIGTLEKLENLNPSMHIAKLGTQEQLAAKNFLKAPRHPADE